MMSSEESEVEGGEEIIIVKHIPWRSDQVSALMQRVDSKIKLDRTPQATRQAKKRIYRGESTRPKPSIDENMPSWLFT